MTDPVSETNHIEITEEPVTHVEEIKRPRGRPKKEKPPQDLTQPKIRGRPRIKPPRDLTQPRIRGRPRLNPPIVRKEGRGRPRLNPPIVRKEGRGRPRINPPPDLTEPKVRGRPRIYPPIVRKEGRGRPRIYEVGTITKPIDPDYFKKYYENVIKVKRNARRLVPLE